MESTALEGGETHMLMSYFRSLLAQLARDEKGQTAVEYGLVIALVCIVVVGLLATAMSGAIGDVTTAIGNAFSAA
jgi:Flp pilus assembly pilin Flp